MRLPLPGDTAMDSPLQPAELGVEVRHIRRVSDRLMVLIALGLLFLVAAVLLARSNDQIVVAEPPVGAVTASRTLIFVDGQDGLITIAGGKLTTYRLMAAEVVDTAVKMLRLSNQLPPMLRPSSTEREPLPGAVGWPEDDDHARVAEQVLEVAEGEAPRPEDQRGPGGAVAGDAAGHDEVLLGDELERAAEDGVGDRPSVAGSLVQLAGAGLVLRLRPGLAIFDVPVRGARQVHRGSERVVDSVRDHILGHSVDRRVDLGGRRD